ncbi:MAG: metallophosphoesterase [Chloroflexota bacterium]
MPRASSDKAFDIVGDVHGCLDELADLLAALRYERSAEDPFEWSHPKGRRFVFAGDLVDRGPDTPGVLRTAMTFLRTGQGMAVVGNHDDKLLRALKGRPVKIAQGLETSLAQLRRKPRSFRRRARDFLANLPSHVVLDDGRLVVAHAGLPEALQGQDSRRAREFAMYGATLPGRDSHGLPLRHDWAADYAGEARVVYGHTAVAEPTWRNGTIDIDTGCVYGHRLTALRYPELELVSVPARRIHVRKSGPFRSLGPGTEPVAEDPVEAESVA